MTELWTRSWVIDAEVRPRQREFCALPHIYVTGSRMFAIYGCKLFTIHAHMFGNEQNDAESRVKFRA